MSSNKCKNCGSSNIDVDPARGDAVCTDCGSVLESNIIVAEVQFQENADGSSSTIGQFVSSHSKGGGCGSFGSSFHAGMGKESQETTLRKARDGITALCNQLRLNQHHIDTACNFFKMALSRQLTRGRKNSHVYAACVYITCRTEGTSHLLIDISDILQICCYQLGRTYLHLSKALCINIPSVDPCLYILRFANRLELGEKTQEVSTTALRLVQRMKRDSIHSGRRPSGLCGAALLMAARLHDFHREPTDIVKIVKVHKTTLRRRLFEFGDTPSSALTLDEFMTVDLEEEQDPPSFKAARKKDRERLMKLNDENMEQMSDMQKDIDNMIQDGYEYCKRKKSKETCNEIEQEDTQKFIDQSTLGIIRTCLSSSDNEDDFYGEEKISINDTTTHQNISIGLGPDMTSLGINDNIDCKNNTTTDLTKIDENSDVKLDDLDEDEIDSYIMTESESKRKDGIWNELNADYLKKRQERLETLAKEKEEGKPEKKKRKTTRKRQAGGPANSAGEAIEKMLQEKKLSSKINYEVLKSLNANNEHNESLTEERPMSSRSSDSGISLLNEKRSLSEHELSSPAAKRLHLGPKQKNTGKETQTKTENTNSTNIKETESTSSINNTIEDDEDYEYDDEEQEQAPTTSELGVREMLRDYRRDAEEDDGFGAYDDDEEVY